MFNEKCAKGRTVKISNGGKELSFKQIISLERELNKNGYELITTPAVGSYYYNYNNDPFWGGPRFVVKPKHV